MEAMHNTYAHLFIEGDCTTEGTGFEQGDTLPPNAAASALVYPFWQISLV